MSVFKREVKYICLVIVCFACHSVSVASNLEMIPIQRDASSLKVMSYNIQQLGFPEWLGNFFEKRRLEKIPETILSMSEQPDVIVFQEAFTETAYRYLREHLLAAYPYATEVGAESCSLGVWHSVSSNCDEASLKANSGVFILSRWPIEEKHSYIYNSYRVSHTFDFLAQKGAVYAKVNKDNRWYHIVGTHLQADGGSHDIRMAQLAEMKTWIDGFKIKKSEAVILAGDFNVNSLETSKTANMLSHANAWVNLHAQGLASVSSSSNEYLKLIYGEQKEKILDYILYRVDHLQPINEPELQVLNFKSEKTWIAERIFSANVILQDLSDHYPVLIAFEFQGISQ
jgi:phospholipase C